MRAALILGLSALFAAPATAQDWATREVCAVDTPRIVEAAFAPASLAELEGLAAKIPNANGKFWQITAPDGAVSHLWGTFHSSDPLILALPEKVRTAIAAAKTVAVEVDFTHASREEYRSAQMMKGRFQDAADPFAAAPSSPDFGVPPKQAEWVRERAIELGWTEDFDYIMSLPGIAEMLLSDPCEDFTQGILPIQDDYIQLLGRLSGARILSLEGRDQMFADLADDDETARAIIATYAAYLQPMQTNAERATSFALYLQGRLGLMEAWDYAFQQQIYGPAGLDSIRQTDAYLLDFRNERFLDRLSDALTEGGVFVAVGSAHLPGNSGLVQLLRDRGYDVTRLPITGEAP